MGYHESEPQLRLVREETAPVHPLESIVAKCAQQLQERQQQLSDDLAYYEAKLGELTSLDPLDFTGLGKIYRGHVERIRTLLNVIGSAA